MHFKRVCKMCQATIFQCRCPSTEKVTEYGICDSCLKGECKEGGRMNREQALEIMNRHNARPLEALINHYFDMMESVDEANRMLSKLIKATEAL